MKFAQHKENTSTVGTDINDQFWKDIRIIYEVESAVRGISVPVISLYDGYLSTKGWTRTLGDYSNFQEQIRIFGLLTRPRREVWLTALHEYAHHIVNKERREAIRQGDNDRYNELKIGGRAHGKAFKIALAELEHKYYEEGHSSEGSAGCRGSSRRHRGDYYNENKICEVIMAAKNGTKATTKKSNTATKTKTELPYFEVTITVEKPFSSMIKGVVYQPAAFTIVAQARDEIAAQNKALRSFGIAHRLDVQHTVEVKPIDKAPRTKAYQPNQKAA